MSILALCPSRGRPAQARECLESFTATRRDSGSRIVFLVDTDDPTREDYPAEHTHLQQPTGCMGGALRLGTDPAVLLDATSVGMVGDDNRFRSEGWDLALDGWLAEHPGIAYGDDGFQHERLPTAWWMSRAVVDEFGLADAGLKHFYMDNWAKELGEGAECLGYLPEVFIEHLHPLAGKAKDDAIYGRSRRWIASDKSTFVRWQRGTRRRDVARLRRLLGKTEGRRVFADWHHPALWESLSILFEDRFGWELYSPHGQEWTQHGWRLEGATPGWTAHDYLDQPATLQGGHHLIQGAEYPDRPRKAVTWAQAHELQWDYVLCSVQQHQRPFTMLARRWGVPLIHQVGNARHAIDPGIRSALILASAEVRARNQRVLRWHQEFDLKLFGYAEPTNPLAVTSLMLRLDTTSCDYGWMVGAKGVRWAAYGGTAPGEPGYLAPMTRVADTLRATGWVWHDKRIGDGYGHVLYTAASMGRPLIGHASHYAGLLGAPLWQDMSTCIDLDRHEPEEALRLLRAIAADPAWYRDLTERTAEAFLQLVDFDAEAEAIREALDSMP